jgi:hypothetical protein
MWMACGSHGSRGGLAAALGQDGFCHGSTGREVLPERTSDLSRSLGCDRRGDGRTSACEVSAEPGSGCGGAASGHCAEQDGSGAEASTRSFGRAVSLGHWGSSHPFVHGRNRDDVEVVDGRYPSMSGSSRESSGRSRRSAMMHSKGPWLARRFCRMRNIAACGLPSRMASAASGTQPGAGRGGGGDRAGLPGGAYGNRVQCRLFV